MSSDAILREVLPAARAAESVTMLGIEILSLSILSLKPTPEIGARWKPKRGKRSSGSRMRRSTPGATPPSSRSAGSRRAS